MFYHGNRVSLRFGNLECSLNFEALKHPHSVSELHLFLFKGSLDKIVVMEEVRIFSRKHTEYDLFQIL